ncbi:hypothetical protein AS594_00370 [Streptomyces agglomeratus]|uniref:Uncharacterized protein n=1 Tax=Streptomyces agglomeratus TaxID=285458 RepID=A0A1E5P0X9_9ACTN|nr:hypothetical protein [Streptomyces agglomeratus]OEJ23201.1 hypothetical protein AS594_00370 [Streptomyces agglomeratus]
MQDALYGLLGGLGGAAIAAGAAYWGPVKAQKEALREAERQRELAQAQAEAVRADERRMARLARVALIRRRIGDWMHLLMFNLDSGPRRVDAESFATAALAARNAVSEAIYDGVSEGFLIVATEASQRGFQESQIRIEEEEQTAILDALDLFTRRIATLISLSDDDPRRPDAVQAASRAGNAAMKVRAELSAQLISPLLDVDNLDVIDTRLNPVNPAGS